MTLVLISIPNLRDGYPTLVRSITAMGDRVVSRGMSVTELPNASVVMKLDPSSGTLPVGVGRGVNLELAAVEALQLLAGVSRPELVTAAAPTFTSVLENPNAMDDGAYGPRIDGALDFIVSELRVDPGSRRCFAAVWHPVDLTRGGDRPCTIGIQFMIRQGELDAFTYMRSNDVWLGTPYDVWIFTQLQYTLARVLDVPVGDYHHTVTSLHLYDRDYERAGQLTLPTDPPPVLPTGLHIPPLHEHLPVDFPPPEYTWGHVRNAARALLDGTSSDLIRAANPWYATKIGEVHAKLASRQS